MTVTLKDGSTVEDPRLDRLYEEDWNSLNYPVRGIMTHQEHTRPRSFTWSVDNWLNQGQEGRCVEYAICHELVARPSVVKIAQIWDVLAEKAIYWPAQKEDYWPGGSYPGASPFYEGTSVLAGMKVAARLGYFEEYRWALSLQDLVAAIGYHGPAVLGINWYTGMRNVDANGYIHVTGQVEGGHAILAHSVQIKWKTLSKLKFWLTRTWDDVDLDASYVWLWNSWGQGWGVKGRCKLSLRDLGRLLAEQGEAAIPVKRLLG